LFFLFVFFPSLSFSFFPFFPGGKKQKEKEIKKEKVKKEGDLLCYQSTASSLTVTLFRLQNNWEVLFVTLTSYPISPTS